MLQVYYKFAMIISVWDDEYGISVQLKRKLQKKISEILKGYQRDRWKTAMKF
jgi:Txe/YoeB family toxin of Txe-Axe toxin-antitoxin module